MAKQKNMAAMTEALGAVGYDTEDEPLNLRPLKSSRILDDKSSLTLDGKRSRTQEFKKESVQDDKSAKFLAEESSRAQEHKSSSTQVIKNTRVLDDKSSRVQAHKSSGKVQPNRVGKKNLTVWFNPSTIKEIKKIALNEDTTIQNLVCEALTDLFEKRGRKHIAQ